MKGDFSRRTFDRQRHFRSVRMQRGRVQLDADWNEQIDLALARLESAAADLVGVAGTPATPGDAFRIVLPAGKPAVKAGRFYADGLLCELEADAALDAQADLPGYVLPTARGRYLAYLDTWEEHVTALDDPELAEPALAGADTATRSRVVAQMKLAPVSDGAIASLFPPGWSPLEPMPPAVTLAARSAGTPEDNRLFRVEVHRGGSLGSATFKWSRDNGVVVAPVAGVAGTQITLAASPPLPPDRRFTAGEWVEATSRAAGLRGEPGVLARLLRVEGNVLTVESWPGGGPPATVDRVRRWDSPGEVMVAAPTTNGGYLALADGVEVLFAGTGESVATPGDYWLIPNRAAAGVLWHLSPGGEPAAREPAGIRHRYAPLALLDFDGGGTWTLVDGGDCRRLFAPAVQLPSVSKVSRGGDTMTGPLVLAAQSDLFVTGQVRVGPGAAPPDGVRLAITGGALRVGSGSALAFPKLGNSSAALNHDGSRLVLEMTGATGSLRLFQNGADRLVLSGGRVGIGTAAPAAALDVRGILRGFDVTAVSSLTLVDGTQAAGLVLTAVDATGSARWQALPQPQIIKPVFFDSPIPINSGNGSRIDLATKTFDSAALPPGATSIILEASAAADSPDSGAIDHYIRVRKDSGSPWLVLLRGRCAGGDDSTAWGTQGVCPLVAAGGGFQFDYQVRAVEGRDPANVDPDDPRSVGPAFNNGWAVRAVGYFL